MGNARATLIRLLAAGLLSGLAGCLPRDPGPVVEAGDARLAETQGEVRWEGHPFTGSVRERHPDGAVRKVSAYVDGRRDGPEETWYPDGTRQSHLRYSRGEQVGLHLGWWEHGGRRFERRFVAGRSHGVHREWYRNGRPLRRVLYRNGVEVEARAWRENGRLSASYVVKHGVVHGLSLASLCPDIRRLQSE